MSRLQQRENEDFWTMYENCLTKKLAFLKLQKQVFLEITGKFKWHGIFLCWWIIEEDWSKIIWQTIVVYVTFSTACWRKGSVGLLPDRAQNLWNQVLVGGKEEENQTDKIFFIELFLIPDCRGIILPNNYDHNHKFERLKFGFNQCPICKAASHLQPLSPSGRFCGELVLLKKSGHVYLGLKDRFRKLLSSWIETFCLT